MEGEAKGRKGRGEANNLAERLKWRTRTMLSCLWGVSVTTFRAKGWASTRILLALDIMRRRALIRTAGILRIGDWID
jgi:hypothetical protein